MKPRLIVWATGWVTSLLLLVSLPSSDPASARSPNLHLLLGNPSAASTNPAASPNNFLLERSQYALSYNNQKKIPNWVSWQLNRSWLGKARRQNNFRPDESLPFTWYKVTPGDYVRSGFDRGHMTPSADRTRNVEDNSATFLMTNIVPQAPDNNQGPWEALESYCRDLALQGRDLYIIAGVAGQSGTMGRRKIAVPASTWKIVVVLEQPGLGIAGITPSTRVIAVNMPNRQGIREQPWQAFVTSVSQLESLTGYNFLSTLSPSLQRTLEAKVDGGRSQAPQTPATPVRKLAMGKPVGRSLKRVAAYRARNQRPATITRASAIAFSPPTMPTPVE